MLLSYNQLVSSLLAPPPSIAVPQPEQSTDPERLVEHIRLISINMHFLVNELRPVQVRFPVASNRSQNQRLRRYAGQREPEGYDAFPNRCSSSQDGSNQGVSIPSPPTYIGDLPSMCGQEML